MDGCWKAGCWSADSGISTTSGAHRNVTSERVEVWGARGVRHIAKLTKSSERGHWNHQK